MQTLPLHAGWWWGESLPLLLALFHQTWNCGISGFIYRDYTSEAAASFVRSLLIVPCFQIWGNHSRSMVMRWVISLIGKLQVKSRSIGLTSAEYWWEIEARGEGCPETTATLSPHSLPVMQATSATPDQPCGRSNAKYCILFSSTNVASSTVMFRYLFLHLQGRGKIPLG